MGAILWGLFLWRQGGEPMPRKPKQSDESLQELSQQNTPWDWWQFKSNVRETWRVILVSEADIFLSESLRILAERLSQSEIGLPLRQICYYSPPEEVGVFSTEINSWFIKYTILFPSCTPIFSKSHYKNLKIRYCSHMCAQ